MLYYNLLLLTKQRSSYLKLIENNLGKDDRELEEMF